jgi:hypothetical protein
MSEGVLGADFFVHFLEHEILALVGTRQAHAAAAEQALRTILLLAERTVVPATAYWEDEWAAPLLEAYAPFRGAGRLQLIGTAGNPDDYLASKREHYKHDPDRYPRYFEEPTRAEYDRLQELWRVRERSTTVDIASFWRQGLTRVDPLFERLLASGRPMRNLDDHLFEVPALLGTRAFISDFVDLALLEREVLFEPSQKQIVRQIVMRDHASSFLTEIAGTAAHGGPTAAVDGLLSGAPFAVDLRRVAQIFEQLGLVGPLAALSAEEMLAVCHSVEWGPVREDILARAAARTSAVWTSRESQAVGRLEPASKGTPSSVVKEICRGYTRAMEAVAREYELKEADLEGRRKGAHIEVHGANFGTVAGHVGDNYNVTFGDVSVTGARLLIAGRSVDLANDAPSAVRQAIAEVVATAAPQDVPEHLEAMSKTIDRREDITESEVRKEIEEAFDGPRAIGRREHLKDVGVRIAQQVAAGTISGGLVQAVLAGLHALGLV